MSTRSVCDTCETLKDGVLVWRCSECRADVCEDCNVGTGPAYLCLECQTHHDDHARYVASGVVTAPGDEWPDCGGRATADEIEDYRIRNDSRRTP